MSLAEVDDRGRRDARRVLDARAVRGGVDGTSGMESWDDLGRSALGAISIAKRLRSRSTGRHPSMERRGGLAQAVAALPMNQGGLQSSLQE